MQDLIGQKLGDYEVLAEIGRGAMGVVYRARQYSLDRPVALKVLSPLLANDASFVERFKREATIAATLDHPSIVRVYEAGAHLDLETGERLHYFAMQYVEGETVHDRLQRENRLELDEAVAIAVHVAQALEYAWRKARVIHRDIKPSNIFLSADGQVKLGDLGLARAAGDSEGGAGLTATGGIVGTAHFMSPEQARGERDIDFRSDIYGLGCMLYRMLCGRHLYEGAFGSVIAQHLTEPPPNLRMVLPDCPVELAKVIEKMLAKHPSGRQQTYDELITELRRVHALITSTAAESGSRPPSAISAAVSASAPPPRKLLPTILYTIMGTTTVILLAGVLLWAPWKQNEQPPLNNEAVKARVAPVTQTLLSAPAESPKTEPKPASEALPSRSESRLQAEVVSQSQPPAKAGTPNATANNGQPVENPARASAQYATPSVLPPAGETPALPAKPTAQVAQATPPPTPAQPPAAQSADDAFLKTVSSLPAEQQVGAVIAKLKELNPNFDGKETHKVENGVVTSLGFSTVGVTDISPVKALKWLRTLTITPPALNQKGSLENLAPLQGMQLTWLWCHNNPIADLSPLKGMPLTTLSFGGTQVSDLSPLTGMKLQVLSFNDTVVSDLATLEGMPLTVLWCNNTKVADLSPLKVMPLRELKCDFVAERDATILRDIKTLARINDLTTAVFWARVGASATAKTPLQLTTPTSAPSSLSAKKQIEQFAVKMKELNREFDGQVKFDADGRKVVKLEFSTEFVTDISPVAAFFALRELVCEGVRSPNNVSVTKTPGRLQNLSVVSSLKQLSKLSCFGNPVEDLSTLKGLRLSHLDCTGTKVKDLTPLSGMPLRELRLAYTSVDDLAPLAGMPLEILNLSRCPVTDLAPLRGMKVLRSLEIWFVFVPSRDSTTLRKIRSLQQINGVPADNFWKKVDAGQAVPGQAEGK